ncbi:MAG: tyrosine-type recombinase/integrase, partial [Clostridia bacterium]|nr:tyrosine-type recombinase/integrase [Clostridia bacterium]
IRSDNTMRIRGKGNKERVVYLNAACREALENYLKVRPVDGVQDRDALFLSRLKKRISLQGIHYIVKNYLKNVDGAEDLSTHKLRHTAATMMYQYGNVDVLVLKDILGHENIGTTQIYTHLADSQVKEALDSNPLATIHAPDSKKTTSDK